MWKWWKKAKWWRDTSYCYKCLELSVLCLWGKRHEKKPGRLRENRKLFRLLIYVNRENGKRQNRKYFRSINKYLLYYFIEKLYILHSPIIREYLNGNNDNQEENHHESDSNHEKAFNHLTCEFRKLLNF